MKRRALVIGSETAGLAGVDADAERVRNILEDRRFDVRTCVAAKATRAGILAAYDALIADSLEADAAVIYYSGHGGRATLPGGKQYQFIVPFDFFESTEDDYRGICAEELSVQLNRLTRRTHNVAVILDCCHAAHMSRSLDIVPRALPHPDAVGLARHLESLGKLAEFAALDPESNPNAVRLVAAGITESAYEYPTEDGRRGGIMTESLVQAIRAAGDAPVSWRAIGQRVRERVLSILAAQRPEIEGPTSRILFDIATESATGVLPVVARDGALILVGGELHGVSRGDEYDVMTAAATDHVASGVIVRARVTTVDATESKLSALGPFTPFDHGRAFLVVRASVRRPVLVDDEALAKAIGGSPLLEPVTSPARGQLGEVRRDGGKMRLRDAVGDLAPLVDPTPANVKSMVEDLERLAVAQGLRELEGESGLPARDVAIEWGVVVEEGNERRARPLEASGAVLTVGQSIYVRVTNRSAERRYVNIFDLGIRHRVTLLNAASPSGILLEPGAEYVLGQRNAAVALRGLELAWPADFPAIEARNEEIMVIVTANPADLTALETSALATRGTTGSLRALLEQVHHGGTREIAPAGAVDAFFAKRISFLLGPSPVTAAPAHSFLIDEAPSATARLISPRASGATTPAALALQLKELIVHNNRALFGGAELRVDTMVITRSKQGDAPYRAETMRFSNIQDGERLPFDDALVFHGPVQDFVDFCVWVSRDTGNTDSLADLLKKDVTSDEFTKAAGALVAVTALAPYAAAQITAVSAAGVLMHMAYTALRHALPKVIGLYRTSLLSMDGFSVGPHPKKGLLRAQEMSFKYLVRAVG